MLKASCELKLPRSTRNHLMGAHTHRPLHLDGANAALLIAAALSLSSSCFARMASQLPLKHSPPPAATRMRRAERFSGREPGHLRRSVRGSMCFRYPFPHAVGAMLSASNSSYNRCEKPLQANSNCRHPIGSGFKGRFPRRTPATGGLSTRTPRPEHASRFSYPACFSDTQQGPGDQRFDDSYALIQHNFPTAPT